MIGCSCEVCTSADLKNKRRRCSLYVVANGQHLVFDTPPDFRDQVLSFGVERVPIYGSPETMRQMRTKFDYVDKTSHSFGGVPRVRFIDQTKPVEIGGVLVTPLPVWHGKDLIFGFRVDGDGRRLGYIPDCSDIPEETLHGLGNLDAMILDGLRPQEHPTHFSTGESVEMLKRIGARQSFITHLTHASEHHELQARLGDAVTVPWDGMNVDLT